MAVGAPQDSLSRKLTGPLIKRETAGGRERAGTEPDILASRPPAGVAVSTVVEAWGRPATRLRWNPSSASMVATRSGEAG